MAEFFTIYIIKYLDFMIPLLPPNLPSYVLHLYDINLFHFHNVRSEKWNSQSKNELSLDQSEPKKEPGTALEMKTKRIN